MTVAELLDNAASLHGNRVAMRVKRSGAWQATTWREYREEARRAARAFLALGLAPGQAVAILGFNAPEWVIADVGGVLAGGRPAGIYTTSSAEQAEYIAAHADAAVAVVETAAHAALLLGAKARLPLLRAIVQWSDEPVAAGVLRWSEFMAKGELGLDAELDARVRVAAPDDVCTLIYTSGTTGHPKAVMISHANLSWVARTVGPLYGLSHDDHSVSYLPLSHIAEQALTIYIPMSVGACVSFAESIEALPAALGEVHPTTFFGVPRVWEKIQGKIEAAGAANSPLRKRIARWARGVGLRGGYAAQEKKSLPLGYGIANRLVFSKVRSRLGLDRAKLCSTGAAPIARATLEFFLSLGIPILEIYGMSECTGPATVSTRERHRTGKAGVVLPGSEVRIAEDGEVLIRGPHVFKGYLKDDSASREAIDDDGWLHSGDVGTLDPDGFLTITDRKKEILITAGGENVSPLAVESQLSSIPAS
jgi:long-subunit acyl-CoA synthetase (AMP-forming)